MKNNRFKRSKMLDAAGKFKKGNPGGPGNPNVRRLGEYQRAIREAVTEGDLQEVMRKVLKKAKAGDMMAVKELLDRVIGKAGVTKNAEAIAIDLPRLATTKDTMDAAQAILAAMGEGRITPDDAMKMSAIIEMARRTIETHDIAERLASLEGERDREDE